MNRYQRRMNRGKKAATLAVIFCVVITAVVIIIISVMDRNNKNRYVPYYEYYTEYDPGEILVMQGDAMLSGTNSPKLIGGVMYYPYDFVAEYMDEYLFWEPDSGRLTVTTGEKVYKFNAGSADYTLNLYTELKLDEPVIREGEIVYLPECMILELYDVEIGFDASSPVNLMTFRDLYSGEDVVTGVIAGKNVRMRYNAGAAEPIYAVIPDGQQVTVYGEPVKSGKDEYIRIRTAEGVAGYVLAGEVKSIETEQGRLRPADTYAPDVADNGKIIMTWQYFGNSAQSSKKSEQKMEKGLDVVSPTWFSFDETKLDGTIISFGNKEYSRWAHSQGLQVWGLITDNFKYDVSKAVLTITENRERAVRTLANYTEFYEMDGINIDFEMVASSDAKYYIQFLRELYPLLRERGMVLSVDMYTPSNWNLYYNRTEVAKTSDFVIVMGYDEYWSTAPEAGPNASINFVKGAIVNTLKEVPPEKLILGIPFFVRVWREEPNQNGTVSSTSKSYSMDAAYDLFISKGCEFVWNATTANYYGEYYATENGVDVRYRVWLEDERSLEEKLILAVDNGIAGVSSWRKGMEKPTIWQLLYGYMKD